MLVKNNTRKKCYWNGREISAEEYDSIREIIRSRPTAPEGFGYRLTDSLEWELYELPAVEETEDLTESEQKAAAYDILTGGTT